MSVNKVILVGNVGKDPETRYLEGGTAVCSFPMATSETYRNRDGERVTNTEWHNVVMWRGLAEIAERYVKKGSQLFIEGKIRTRSWEDKDGNKRYTTEIIADNMQMLGRKPDDSGEAGTTAAGQAAQPAGNSAGIKQPANNATTTEQPGTDDSATNTTDPEDPIAGEPVDDDLPF